MADLTRADFIQQVLWHVGITPKGETPTAEDSDVTGKIVDQTFKELEDDGVAYWETSAIPEKVVPALKDAVGADVLLTYKLIDVNAHEMRRAKGMRRLYRSVARPASGKRTRACYF